MGSAETFPAFMLSRRSESSAIPRAPSPEKNTFKLHLPPTWTTSAQHSTCPFVLPCSQGDISPVPHRIPADSPLLPTAIHVLNVPLLQHNRYCYASCCATRSAPLCHPGACNPPYPQDRDSFFYDCSCRCGSPSCVPVP